MDPVAAAQYGMGAFALAVLAAVVLRRNGYNNSTVNAALERLAEAQERQAKAHERLAAAYERLVSAVDRQIVISEQQSRMLERLSDRVDELWRGGVRV